jgi:hypothetical protein
VEKINISDRKNAMVKKMCALCHTAQHGDKCFVAEVNNFHIKLQSLQFISNQLFEDSFLNIYKLIFISHAHHRCGLYENV